MIQVNQTRFICGIHPDNFAWNLQPQEEFDTPEVMMAYSPCGTGAVSRNLHKTIREHICRGEWKNKRRPVLINNWEATYFDFTGDKLVSIAKNVAELGVELFVMDDGWFGKRDGDNSGLGDWFPNDEKLGCTLKKMADSEGKEALISAVYHHVEANAAPVVVQVQGLKAESKYQVYLDLSCMKNEKAKSYSEHLPYGYREGEMITGAALLQCGLVIPDAFEEYQAWQIYIVECVETERDV